MLKEHFKEQLEIYSPLTEDILEHVQYKRVWSGEMMVVGDKVLYALVYPKGEPDAKMMSLLERELDKLDAIFDFIKFEKEMIPVLKFKDDTKVRT